MRDDTLKPSEEIVIHALLVAIGAIPVVLALVQHAHFGAEATLGLLMLAAGVSGAMRRDGS